jgi:hypothetical protein
MVREFTDADDSEPPWIKWTTVWPGWVCFWPCHWKGWLLILVALPIFALAFVIAFAFADSGHPLIGLIAAAIITVPIYWIGIKHSEAI